jgi:predicted Zn-dependent protease
MTAIPEAPARTGWSFLLTRLVAVVVLVAVSACTTVPASGQQRFTGLLSEEQEKQIGAEEHQKVLEEYGRYESPALERYVDSVGQLLAATSEMRDLNWTFTVLDSGIVNAMALPGGYVYVTRGLLALAQDEAELAAVIGHEIGHVTARHAAARYSRGVATQLGVLAAGVLGQAVLGTGAVGDVAGVVGQGFLASYSRDQEYEADSLGIRYSSRIGFDPDGMARFLEMLERERQVMAEVTGMAPRGASIFDTHPPSLERADRARQIGRGVQVADAMRARDVLLDQIDGMTYGDSAKQGFVRGQTFAHPELGFRFVAPDRFTLINTSDRVIATGPQNATISLDMATGVGPGSMTAYLRDQWARGVQIQGLEQIEVNGMEAATAQARGSTRAGQVDVRLVAIRWRDGTIYRFQFVSPTQATAGLSEAFRRTTYSFRPLTQAERNDLQPWRIRIHTVRAGETIESIARRMPFDEHAVERFKLLNALGPGDRLEPGMRVKVVAEG